MSETHTGKNRPSWVPCPLPAISLPLGQMSKGVLGLRLSSQCLLTFIHLLLRSRGSCLLLLFPLSLGFLLLFPRTLLFPWNVLFRLALCKLFSW